MTLYAKKLAKEFHGVIEDPQLENSVISVVKGKKFTRSTRNADIISICWYIDPKESLSCKIADFIDLIEKYFPFAMPRRYGSFEPPQYKLSENGKEHLIDFLKKESFPVIYCQKPVTHIFLSDACVDNQRFCIEEYRCNKIEIELLKEAYSEENRQFAVKRLFKETAKLFKPFYAEIIDEKDSTVCSWWWKGIPQKRGNTVIIGEPYSVLMKDLPSENQIAPDLYYFDNDLDKVRIPSKLVSKKKFFAKKERNIGYFADNFKSAKIFPFSR